MENSKIAELIETIKQLQERIQELQYQIDEIIESQRTEIEDVRSQVDELENKLYCLIGPTPEKYYELEGFIIEEVDDDYSDDEQYYDN